MEKKQKGDMRKKLILIAAALLGIVLMAVPGLIKKEDKETQAAVDVEFYSEKLEDKIKDLLASAEGVGEPKVVITLDGTGELVYAQNEDRGESDLSCEYVIIKTDKGEEAVLISEIYPRVRGVAVVCSGGSDPAVKERVTELISAALGISSNKIAVSG